MNLFRRARPSPLPAENTVGLALPSDERKVPVPLAPISLNAEQKQILDRPVDPRVDRILHDIYETQAAADRALNSRRVIDFPVNDSGERHVVQDEQGFWRIVPGPAPSQSKRFFHAI